MTEAQRALHNNILKRIAKKTTLHACAHITLLPARRFTLIHVPKKKQRLHMSEPFARRGYLMASVCALAAALVAACKSTVDLTQTAPEKPAAPPPPSSALPPAPAVIGPIESTAGSARRSSATTARAYREDGASHIYGLNSSRIYKGRLPPQLYAIGVLDIHIDRLGRVTGLEWSRAPRHAPEVIAEIEATVKRAAPFPAPARMGKVVYTDTWLWHISGQFQLDTLTEGQD